MLNGLIDFTCLAAVSKQEQFMGLVDELVNLPVLIGVRGKKAARRSFKTGGQIGF